jgi:hypothetical protein
MNDLLRKRLSLTVYAGGKILACFEDYNIAVLCLPALARACGVPVKLYVPPLPTLAVGLPRGVEAKDETRGVVSRAVLTARP